MLAACRHAITLMIFATMIFFAAFAAFFFFHAISLFIDTRFSLMLMPDDFAADTPPSFRLALIFPCAFFFPPSFAATIR